MFDNIKLEISNLVRNVLFFEVFIIEAIRHLWRVANGLDNADVNFSSGSIFKLNQLKEMIISVLNTLKVTIAGTLGT